MHDRDDDGEDRAARVGVAAQPAHEDDADADRDDADGLRGRDVPAEDDRGGGEDEHRREPAGQGIDEPELRPAVRGREEDEVRELERGARGDVRPGGRARRPR